MEITAEELYSVIPLWEEALDSSWLPVSGFSGGFFGSGLFVFRYAEGGAVYMISPDLNSDNESCTLFKDGQPIGNYGGGLCAAFDDCGGENYFIVLCNEDFDVNRLNEPYTEQPEDFYLLGTVFPRSIDKSYTISDTARLKEGASLDGEKFVIYTREDKEHCGELFDAPPAYDDAAMFCIKCDNQLEVREVSVDTETNRLNMLLEETGIPSGGYSVIRIQSDALMCVDISDFSYVIE